MVDGPVRAGPPARDDRRQKAAEIVAWEIRRRIIHGEIGEGENLLPEPELIKEFGVSRPTLREAMRILETQDLISVDQGQRKGARVRLPSIGHTSLQTALLFQVRKVTLKEIIEAWLLLEPPIVASLAKATTRGFLTELREHVHREVALPDSTQDSLHRCRSFHQLVLQANENSALGSVLEILRNVVQMHFDKALVSYEGLSTHIHRSETLDKEHLALIDLIESGDSKAVESFWHGHIDAAGQAMIAEFGNDTIVVLPDNVSQPSGT